MSDLNKDGLKPGQLVDFETMRRVTRERKAVEDQPTRRAKTTKASTDNQGGA